MKRKSTGVVTKVTGFFRVAAGLLAVEGNLPAAADVPAEPSMLERSPFIPPGFAPPQSGRADATARSNTGGYEFRGVYQLGNDYRFLVSEPRSRSGNWVQVGGDYEKYEVRGYDPDTETLTLFFNNSENELKLAEVESNPTPLPVSGQVQAAPAQGETPTPVRRTIRPASRTNPAAPGQTAPPPPAWLQKLREEAAAKRAQVEAGLPGLGPGGGITPSGTSVPGISAPPPPTEPPPTPPPDLTERDIPPPPTELPPPPPPEIWEKIQQSMNSRFPGG